MHLFSAKVDYFQYRNSVFFAGVSKKDTARMQGSRLFSAVPGVNNFSQTVIFIKVFYVQLNVVFYEYSRANICFYF